MKLSAYHKSKGDNVEWYEPLLGGEYDIVYMSKVFSFSPDYIYPINAKKIIKGGSGYCIDIVDGKEVFDKSKDIELPYEIEHIYPDYSIYGITDTAYGFMSRGCPRGCEFCHVKTKEGQRSYKVADLKEFWNRQKNIELMDPNTLACKEWKNILQQLIDSKARVNFNQGLDIRLMTEEKAKMLSKIKIKAIHFAWDRYQDKDMIVPKFEMFKKYTTIDSHNLQVYVLTNFNTTFEQDLERVYTLRNLGYAPYITIYNKDSLPKGHRIRKLQRWVNCRWVFWSVETFEEYQKKNQNRSDSMPRPETYNKYTNQDIYNIIASYEVTGNFGVTAKELGFPENSVKYIYYTNYEKDEFVEFRNKKKAEFNDKASKIIDKALKRLDMELDTEKPIPINNLSTVIGTLHDKMNISNVDTKSNETPNVQINIVDHSNLEKAMYEEDKS